MYFYFCRRSPTRTLPQRRNKSEARDILRRVATVRACRVSMKDVHGITHHVEVQAATLFEAAAAAVAAFRQQQWAADALTPHAIVRVEVALPAIVHDVPLKTLERWLDSPSASPREDLAKRKTGGRR
jgi:hypothetical protein